MPFAELGCSNMVAVRQVDPDLEHRLQQAMDDGRLETHSMARPEDRQTLDMFTLDIEGVMRDLLADERYRGHQKYGFSKDMQNGQRVFSSSTGGLSFQRAQDDVGPDTAVVSIVIFIDGTYVKNNIPVRPIYGESELVINLNIAFDIIYHIACYESVYSMLQNMLCWCGA